MLSSIEYKTLGFHDTYPLRHSVLRPTQLLSACAYPLDETPTSCHIGCYIDGAVVGIGSIFQEDFMATPRPHVWRIRGMAVSEAVRGQGIGGHILSVLLTYARTQGLPATVWCNGRLSAQNFYQRHGFVSDGNIFDVPTIGPHLLFIATLTT